MRLDESSIIETKASLDFQEEQLIRTLKTAPRATPEAECAEAQLQSVREKKLEIAQIIRRNAAVLNRVKKKVFVSTHLEPGGVPPEWVRDLILRINENGHPGESEFEFVFGDAPQGGDFRLAILEKIVECSCFLTIISKEGCLKSQREAPSTTVANQYLMEEAGAAYALAKPIVIALESGLQPRAVGALFGQQWQRIYFQRSPEGLGTLSQTLCDALERAPRNQLDDVEKRRQAVAPLFR